MSTKSVILFASKKNFKFLTWQQVAAKRNSEIVACLIAVVREDLDLSNTRLFLA